MLKYNMDSPTYNTPRPTPKFFQEPQSFSTKKEKGRTPRVRIPPPPRPSAKKSATRLQFAKRNISKAMPVSFKSPDKTISTPLYNENKRESYFEQCFEIICKLGSGSFGDVYKVKSREDGMYYAIKKSKERFKGSVDRKGKLEEVNKHEKLPVHRNCVKFIKAWEEKEHLYIQTELCKMSLSAYADEHHNIAEKLIMNYLIDLLMAVKHLHDHDLIHMDIKPENVFISDTDVCKLGDFGLVLDLNKREEWMDALEGDPKYLAPELMSGNFGKPADIFSLGITILELATDLDLPRGDELWHQLRSGKLPDELLKGISPELKHLIEWMMQPDLSLRPTVDEVLEHPYVYEKWKKRLHEQTVSKDYKLMTPPKQDIKRCISWSEHISDSDDEVVLTEESAIPLATPLDLFSSDDEVVNEKKSSGKHSNGTPVSLNKSAFRWNVSFSSGSPTPKNKLEISVGRKVKVITIPTYCEPQELLHAFDENEE